MSLLFIDYQKIACFLQTLKASPLSNRRSERPAEIVHNQKSTQKECPSYRNGRPLSGSKLFELSADPTDAAVTER